MFLKGNNHNKVREETFSPVDNSDNFIASFIGENSQKIDLNKIKRTSVTNKNIVKSSSSADRLPNYTEIHTTSPNAAGIPVLEVVKRLEEEGLINAADRIALKNGLYSSDEKRRASIVKSLGEVELGSNSRFAVRRLKCVIHQNGSGEPSSKYQETEQNKVILNGKLKLETDNIARPAVKVILMGSPKSMDEDTFLNSSPNQKHSPVKGKRNSTNGVIKKSNNQENNKNEEFDEESTVTDIQETINQVVGDAPVYSSPSNFNVLAKISQRLEDFRRIYNKEKMGRRTLAVLVGNGSFNPLTRMHLRSYFLAKQYLEAHQGCVVLGSLLSPCHGVTVRERYRTNPSEIIPSPHRLAIAQLLVQNSKWLTVDPWEITRRRAMDYLSLLEHVQNILKDEFPADDFKIFYVTKSFLVPSLSPKALRSQNCSCLTVCRPPESDLLRSRLSGSWKGLIQIVEDTAILDSSIDVVTSRKVRDNIRAGASVEHLVGMKVQEYTVAHKLGDKMNGDEKWERSEKVLPSIAARPAAPTLPSQYSQYLSNGGLLTKDNIYTHNDNTLEKIIEQNESDQSKYMKNNSEKINRNESQKSDQIIGKRKSDIPNINTTVLMVDQNLVESLSDRGGKNGVNNVILSGRRKRSSKNNMENKNIDKNDYKIQNNLNFKKEQQYVPSWGKR